MVDASSVGLSFSRVALTATTTSAAGQDLSERIGDNQKRRLTRFAVHVDFRITSLDDSLRGDVKERIVEVSDRVPGDVPEKPLFTVRSCNKIASSFQ